MNTARKGLFGKRGKQMNRNRRERIAAAINLIEDIKEQITNIMDEESEAFDNLPEAIQESQRGEDMDQNVCDLDEVCETLESAVDQLNEILER